jgi:hypothetical protein
MAWSINVLALPDFFFFFFLDGDVLPPRVVNSRGVLVLILTFEVASEDPLGTVLAAEQLELELELELELAGVVALAVTRVADASNNSLLVFPIFLNLFPKFNCRVVCFPNLDLNCYSTMVVVVVVVVVDENLLLKDGCEDGFLRSNAVGACANFVAYFVPRGLFPGLQEVCTHG